jgi:hypothetical protein
MDGQSMNKHLNIVHLRTSICKNAVFGLSSVTQPEPPALATPIGNTVTDESKTDGDAIFAQPRLRLQPTPGHRKPSTIHRDTDGIPQT